MSWDEIMKISDPHEALKQIEQKIRTENLLLQEMEDKVEEYANLHGIDTFDMAFYPNGERVLGN